MEYIQLYSYFPGAQDKCINHDDSAKQVEVYLHTEVENPISENGDVTEFETKSFSNGVIDDTEVKAKRDKKNKTTNVPSNCSTAILMPLNGVKRNSQKRANSESSPTEIKEFQTINDNNKESKIDLNTSNTGIICHR